MPNASRARNGEGGLAALNNNKYAMELVDVDSDPGTFDSSSATLSLPAGATVQFAGLYYGARTSKGTGGAVAPDAAARGTVLLKRRARSPTRRWRRRSTTAPRSKAPTPASPTSPRSSPPPARASTRSPTSRRGPGKTATAAGRWSSPTPTRRAAAQHPRLRRPGLDQSRRSAAADRGRRARDAERRSVAASVGVVAYEGDRGSSGDRLWSTAPPSPTPPTRPTTSSTAPSPSAATISAAEPELLNQLGFDADVLGADGILGNDATGRRWKSRPASSST